MVPDILLIADEPHLCQQVVDILHEYDVDWCFAYEALNICIHQPVRVVLVVQDLPGASGLELFDSLRAARPGLLGFLIVDRESAGTLCPAAMDSGFSGLFSPPLDPDQVCDRIAKEMESAALREENARLRALLPLYGLGEHFMSSTSQHDVLESLLNVIGDQTAADSLSVMLYDENEGVLRIAASRGIPQEMIDNIRIKPGDKIAGRVFQERTPVILNQETQRDSRFADLLKRPEIVSAVSFPMIVRDKILGVLNVSYTDGDIRFADSDIEILGIFSTQAALAIENVHAFESVAQEARLQALLEQYVAPEVAEVLLASDAALTTGLGEVKDATVLFADIRNFTGMVQEIPLAVLRDFLNEFFQVFTETIFEYRGTVDKFMGDAVLAVFGALIELDNPSLTAIETALAIQKRFAVLKDEWQTRDPFFTTIDLGFAVTRGEMFLGNVGSARRLDYTVIGTEVNIAQRLASKATSSRIYITDKVLEDIKKKQTDKRVVVKDVGKMVLKGVQYSVPTFSVLGLEQETS
ncbi:MAG: GAF domain-containing protein [Candidatus Electrothrix sp. AW5]|nr:GAF domain-containing protein [Candidatus Electrothrix sp. AX1]MCI5179409.1 GAF domain-containing protein [Candidatus Electrothrix gigas]MCI5183479.1 GAF domain-containing protein [Candidatus Electrothrix gigas]MCI5196090.1 GAF domain-containing protein [Candidatus Electrothrix gigas]